MPDEKNNIKSSDIKYVFLTHAHDDHAGFLNEVLEETYISSLDKIRLYPLV